MGCCESEVEVKIKLIAGGKLPSYKRDGDACLDCCARLDGDLTISPKTRRLVNLGFVLELPVGWEAVIRPRSGLTSIEIDNGIGTIDSNYRGEVKACVINAGNEYFTISNGDRICQMAVRRAPKVKFIEVDELSETNRGDNGFGSTGVK